MITAEKVRIICGRCQITIPGSLEGLGFRACYRASAQSSTARFRKPNVLGELQESVPYEMTDKSLRVKLVIVSLFEHNLKQRISHFQSFNSTRKVNTDESFGSFTFKHSPTKLQVVGLFLSLQLCWNFICLHVLSKNYMMPFFASCHRLDLTSRVGVAKILFD